MRLSILNIKKICALLQGVIASGWGFFTSAHVPETVSTAFPFPIFFPEGWKGGRGGEGRGAVHR